MQNTNVRLKMRIGYEIGKAFLSEAERMVQTGDRDSALFFIDEGIRVTEEHIKAFVECELDGVVYSTLPAVFAEA